MRSWIRFAVVSVLLFHFAGTVLAVEIPKGWTRIGGGDSSTVYVDLTTIRRSGNMVKMWSLNDFKSVQDIGHGRPFMSLTSQNEYDCKEERSRQLYFTSHTEKMGNGAIAFSSTEITKWYPVPPAGGLRVSWDLVCNKD